LLHQKWTNGLRARVIVLVNRNNTNKTYSIVLKSYCKWDRPTLTCTTRNSFVTISMTWINYYNTILTCTTRNSFVTISMTWPVWRTKSPFLRPLLESAEEERQPGMFEFAWLRVSRVGLVWKTQKRFSFDKVCLHSKYTIEKYSMT
jgi:hypothetical protein